ncbi:MAG TPA: TonB-dependent receptor [Bacteroidales bacterium]|nr:TonB-dependent receptor [Bacteroidales bacterium]
MRKHITEFIFLFCLMLCSQLTFAQNLLVKGQVVDKEGNPLPGVSVYKIGSTAGTFTSIDGKYALSNLNEKDSIRFTYVGFNTERIQVGNQTVINVIMSETTSSLAEVQVVAFQTQKKNSVIGSINTVNPTELKIAPTNLTNALAGKIAGIISYQRSGEPGQDNAEFFIRGVTSFGYANSPLILIDGLEVSTTDLARIEPDNIASFSIMKDATATALYGARGANGVILVTTKTGKKGKAAIAVRIENSLTSPTRTNQFLGGVDYMELYNKALRTRDPEALLYYSKDKIEGTRAGLDPQIYPNINWYDELFTNTVQNQKANMSISGGGEVAQYYLSVSYTDEKGLLKLDRMNNFNNNINIKRYNLRANIDVNLTKTTKALVKFYSLIDRYNGPQNDAGSIFSMVMQANPVNFPKYYLKDESTQFVNHVLFGNKGNGGYPNPYAEMVRGYKDRFSSTTTAQFQLEQDLDMLTKGLKLRGMASLNSYSMSEVSRGFTPFYYGLKEVDSETGVLHSIEQISEGTEYLTTSANNKSASNSFYFEGVGQYNRVFNSKHDVGGLIVVYARELLTDAGNDVFSSLPFRNMGISGRATYAFDNRYFSELNFGYNGSEKFSKQNRFGFFPSAGLGWVVSNEKFFSRQLRETITMLKFKATYGLVGNDAISSNRFYYLSSVNLNDGNLGHVWGEDFGNSYNGYNINNYANPEVTWEIAEKTNFGMELGLFGKANLQIDYFTENRNNIYMWRDYIPASMGLTAAIASNIGKAESHGIDGSLDYKTSFNKNLWVTSRINFTYATNKIVENGEPQYPYPYMSNIGQPMNQPRGLIAERLFIDDLDVLNAPVQYNQMGSYMAGDIKYIDINRDGKIDDSDMVPIGYPTVPEIVYGFGSSVGYKNLDVSFFFQGSGRSSFFIDPTSISPFVNERNALRIIADNHWSDENPDPNAFWPRMSVNTVSNNEKASTWWLRDGSFLRLKSVEVGYSLPEKLLKKINIEKARFYLSGTNLLVFSNFKLWDPEMGGKGLGYPPQKIINMGLNFNF